MAEEVMDDLSWNANFGDAFKTARQRGLQTFDWKGKRYSTNVNDPMGVPVAPTELPPSAPPPAASALPPTVPTPPPTNLNDPMGGTTTPPPTTVPYRPGEASAQWPSLMEQTMQAAPRSPQLDLMQQQGPEPDPYYTPPEPPMPPAVADAATTPVAAPIQPQAQVAQPQAFEQASQRLDPSYAPGPPATPEEKSHRMEGWKMFLQKIASDPGLQMMALKMGTQMMQPIQPGGTPASHLGASLQSGVDYGLAYNEIQRKAGMEKDAGAMQDRLSEQQMAESKQRVSSSQTAQAGQIQQQNELVSSWPERKKKFELDLSNAQTEQDIVKLKKQIADYEFNNKDKAFELEMKTAQARLRAEEARIKAYEAAAAKSDGKKDGTALVAGAKAFVAATDDQVRQAWIQDAIAKGEKPVAATEVPMALAREKFFFMNPGMAKEYMKHAAIAGLSEEHAAAQAAVAAATGQQNPPGSEAEARARSLESDVIWVLDPKTGKYEQKVSPAPGAAGKYQPPAAKEPPSKSDLQTKGVM